VGSRLTIRVPRDYVLSRDVCSYGYFLLAPNHWDVKAQAFHRVFDLAEGPTRAVFVQPPDGSKTNTGKRGRAVFKGRPLRAHFDRALTRVEQREVRPLIARMLRLDEDARTLAAYHNLDPRWKRSGRGRLLRSPTLFEDIVKTVTSCNVAWPSTVHMNRRLCEVVGRGGAFPTPARLSRARASTLRARCRVGYRDARLIELAKRYRRGEIDPGWCEDPATSDDELRAFLLSLPGIGPYAAANIMQLLGRYADIPHDTESVRHGKTVLGLTGTDRRITRAMDAHYAPFGAHKFRSYWFELWEFYESKRGPAELWDREEVGSSFTASQL